MRIRITWTMTLAVMGTSMPIFLPVPAFGQGEEAVHDELRALRDNAMAAFQDGDIDRLLNDVHPNAVVTWQNAELCRGRDGVRKFYERMMKGEESEVKDVDASIEVDELSILYGDDTAIAFGSIQESFALRSGLNFDLDNRWTATLVREDDRWLIAAFHVSTNMFDNGLQDLFLRWNMIWSGGVALVIGLVLGIGGMKLLSRKRNTAKTPPADAT